MTSLVALYRRRATALLLFMGVLLMGALLLHLRGDSAVPTEVYTDAVTLRLFSPLAQVTAFLFWATLMGLIGMVWSRAFFGSVSSSDVFITGALLSVTSFPIFKTLLVYLLSAFHSLGILPALFIVGHDQAYMLLSLFFVLLLGLMTLIAREGIKAALHEPQPV